MTTKRIFRSAMITTADVDRHCAKLKANGCTVDRDRDAGTVTVKDGPHVVLLAIQKGRGQPWIATFHNAGRFAWLKPEEM